MTKTIDFVYFNAGGGHRAAAHALQDVIGAQHRGWTTRLVDLSQVLDPDGQFRKVTGMAPEDLYNMRLARGWTLGLATELKLLQAMIRMGHASLVRQLAQHWLRTEPDLVVSLIPNFNRALYASLTSTLPGVPFVTVLTDMADLPPHFWIEPGQDQHLVCGTAQAARQALDAGYPQAQIWRTSGMILRPSFYRAYDRDRDAQLRDLGLDPQVPTGIVLFGGQGSAQMVGIARALGDAQLILMCGHNQVLAKRLRAMRCAAPHAVVEFTPEVGVYMRLGDYFIGKPGPGSLSEAIHMGLPVITFENACTMPQERFNCHWVRERNVGLVIRSTRGVRAAVSELTARLSEFRDRVGAIDNRAVFEVPEILAQLLRATAVPIPAALAQVEHMASA